MSVSGKHIALLPGDIDTIGLDDLLNHIEDTELETCVVVYPHHGGRQRTTQARRTMERFLRSVASEVVLFSIGRGIYGTPNPETVNALRRTLPDARIICTQLSEHCARTLTSEPLSHINSVFAQGRLKRQCCGGTIVIPLESPDSIEPTIDAHIEYINTRAETPLCLADLER